MLRFDTAAMQQCRGGPRPSDGWRSGLKPLCLSIHRQNFARGAVSALLLSCLPLRCAEGGRKRMYQTEEKDLAVKLGSTQKTMGRV